MKKYFLFVLIFLFLFSNISANNSKEINLKIIKINLETFKNKILKEDSGKNYIFTLDKRINSFDEKTLRKYSNLIEKNIGRYYGKNFNILKYAKFKIDYILLSGKINSGENKILENNNYKIAEKFKKIEIKNKTQAENKSFTIDEKSKFVGTVGEKEKIKTNEKKNDDDLIKSNAQVNVILKKLPAWTEEDEKRYGISGKTTQSGTTQNPVNSKKEEEKTEKKEEKKNENTNKEENKKTESNEQKEEKKNENTNKEENKKTESSEQKEEKKNEDTNQEENKKTETNEQKEEKKNENTNQEESKKTESTEQKEEKEQEKKLTKLEIAFSTGNSSEITKQEIFDGMEKFLENKKKKEISLKKEIFQADENGNAKSDSLTNLVWNFNHNTRFFEKLDQKGIFSPIFTSNTNNKNLDYGIVGETTKNQRVMLLGANPFLNNITNDDMKKALNNSISWLTKGEIKKEGAKIILSDAGKEAYNYLKNNYNLEIQECNGDKLESCLNEDIKLLILGNSNTCGNGGREKILNLAKEKNINLIYLSLGWGENTCNIATMNYFGINSGSDYSNYWAKSNLNGKNMIEENRVENSTEKKLYDLAKRIETNNFSTTWETCSNYYGKVNCNIPSLNTEFLNDTNKLRNNLRDHDKKNINIFNDNNADIYRLIVLLGDKYREEISYPIDKEKNTEKWYKAFFANSTVYNNRNFTTVEQNLGNFVTKKENPTIIPSQDVELTSSTTKRVETAKGIYVWPGKTIKISRKDNSNARVTTSINMIRDTTRIFNKNGYNRPHYITTPNFELKSGETITLTNPYGGPLYFQIEKTKNEEQISITVEGAGKHPVLNNPENESDVENFINEVNNTEAEWVVVATEFMMIHSRLENWKQGINSGRYNGDLKKFIENLWEFLIKNTYTIAGFQNGKNLVPSDKVKAYCEKFGIDCESKTHATPERIQHAISDKISMCGSMCSGNPYDSGGYISPTGWGDAHEIGHNLQVNLLKIYDNKSIEVSNNIYPYALYQKYNSFQTEVSKMESRPLSRVNGTDILEIFNLIKESLSSENPTASMKEKIWTKPGVYDDNSYRYSFYVSLVAIAKYYNQEKMDTGWELFSLLNIMQREFTKAMEKEETWEAKKSFIGFDSYNFKEAEKIKGNDFMAIVSSKIIGKNMKPFFDMWGVEITEKAAKQIESMGLENSEKLFFPLYDHPRYYMGEKPILMTPEATYNYKKEYEAK